LRNIFTYRWITIACVALITVLLFASCKSTKLVGEDEYLLNKVEIQCDNPNVDEGDLEASIKQMPNRKTLGFLKFHLWTYNLTHPKDTSKHLPKFITRIGEVVGEPPVIYKSSLHYKSMRNLENFLQKEGYYNFEINDSLIVNEKHPKKATLSFQISPGKPYTINSITYDIIDPFVKDILLEDTSKAIVKAGDIFDMDLLLHERERILNQMKNNGYYYFGQSNFHYYADTTNFNTKVDIRLSIKKSFEADRYFLEEIFTRQRIKQVYFYVNFNRGKYAVEKEAYIQSLDTIHYEDFIFLVDGELKIKPEVILQANYIKTGDDYSQKEVKLTQKSLSALKQFKGISIIFRESKDYRREVWNAENPWLDAHIYLSPSNRQSYTAEAEGTNSSGNFGLAGVLTYQNRNIFRGAEIFSAKFMGSLQTLAGDEDLEERFLNTFELGTELKLDVPKLMLPLQSEGFIKEHNPSTSFRLSFNHQNRPDYTRTLGNASFGYKWQSKNDFFIHRFNPIEYYTVKIFNFDPVFREQIDSLYIRYSFENQLITAMSWDMIFNNQNIKKTKNHWYIWTNLETSGNLMRAFGPTINLPTSSSNAYKLFDLEFAQYIKADIDARFYQEIDKHQNLVYRVYIGAGIPFGNSTQGLPFVKKYYIGGANDIRAWQVRTLGPGTYSGGALFNQIADMKLLFNIEYRFDLIAFVKGAFFFDAGNIWALDKSDDREGALFDPNTFYKEIALGTGLGLRFDFSFFILRFDFGMPLYDPAFPENDRWLSTFDELNLNDFTLNFGIGYPF
jgi:outer membrane protein assembly factor BamA